MKELEETFEMWEGTTLYQIEEPAITLTDEELLAECERRAISTKITK